MPRRVYFAQGKVAEKNRASAAEKLEAKLLAKGKRVGDIQESEAEVLMDHPLLADRKSRLKNAGSHIWVVRFPEAVPIMENKIDLDDVDLEGAPACFDREIFRYAHHDIMISKNKCYEPFVRKILSIIWVTRKQQEERIKR